MRTSDRTYYDTGTSTPVHQIPTQPYDYNYNYKDTNKKIKKLAKRIK